MGLVGCTATGATGCTRPAAQQGLTELISVSGDTASPPDVEVPVPFRASRGGFVDLVEGEGTPLTSPSQLMAMDLTLIDGETGERLFASGYDGDTSGVFPLSQWVEVLPAFENALACATSGSRIVVTLPPGDVAPEAAASLGLAEDATGIAVVDLRTVYLAHAQGTLQFNTGNNLPSVVRAPDGRPGVIVPDAAAPTEVVVQTLIKGDGAEVPADGQVRAHVTAVTWNDDQVFESSWGEEPRSLSADSAIPAVADALVGKTVGSQILVVVPQADAESQPGLPTGSALVYVIDILGLDPAPAR